MVTSPANSSSSRRIPGILSTFSWFLFYHTFGRWKVRYCLSSKSYLTVLPKLPYNSIKNTYFQISLTRFLNIIVAVSSSPLCPNDYYLLFVAGRDKLLFNPYLILAYNWIFVCLILGTILINDPILVNTSTLKGLQQSS